MNNGLEITGLKRVENNVYHTSMDFAFLCECKNYDYVDFVIIFHFGVLYMNYLMSIKQLTF